MIKTTERGDVQFTWQAIFWRLLVTIFLLTALAGFGRIAFGRLNPNSEIQVISPSAQDAELIPAR